VGAAVEVSAEVLEMFAEAQGLGGGEWLGDGYQVSRSPGRRGGDMRTVVERMRARAEALAKVAGALEGLTLDEQAAVLEGALEMVEADRRPKVPSGSRPALAAVEPSAAGEDKPRWMQAAEAVGPVGNISTVQAVAKALKGTPSAVSHALRRAEEQGAVKREGNGVWRRVA
jgi:DNA-binding transcriptional ArsR family regulator